MLSASGSPVFEQGRLQLRQEQVRGLSTLLAKHWLATVTAHKAEEEGTRKQVMIGWMVAETEWLTTSKVNVFFTVF